jgi:diacylglycerol kinase family enzyme
MSTVVVLAHARKSFGRGLVLAANVGTILGGLEAFTAAKPDDGLLELGVATARNTVDWARTFGRVALLISTNGDRSALPIRFDRKFRCEVDGAPSWRPRTCASTSIRASSRSAARRRGCPCLRVP